MVKKTLLLTFILAAMKVTTTAFADKGAESVCSVTFDEGGSEYQLMDGATLIDGRDGKAVRLDGEKKQYVKLPDNLTKDMEGDYTISVDVYPENDANFARVFDLGTDTSNFAYFTAKGGGVAKYRYKGDDLFADGIELNLNEWNNVTITKSGGEARLFINGHTAATSRSFVHSLSDLGETNANYLGKSHFENDAYFTGMIDNFEIYDYAIADEDIMTACSAAVNTKLVNVMYDKDNKITGVRETRVVGEKTADGVKLQNIPVSDAATVKTYAYAAGGEFKMVNEIKNGNSDIKPLPEDTWETTIGVHDPSIFKDPKSGMYYVYSTGMIDIYKSEDLIHWTKTVGTLKDLPQCVYDTYKHDKKEEYSNIWAPDMFYDESDTATPYHLTCSYSDEFGKNNSSIILFKSVSPEGPWENGQIIFTSKRDDEELSKVNAIDSNICVDRETGQKYMVYGSFWHGIHIKELNEDGTVKEPDKIGKCIMSRKDGIGGPEGAYIIYNEDNGYYYLFTSFDNLSETYNIRVARSKSITGPYLDQKGVDVNSYEAEDNTPTGYKLMGSWQFPYGNTYYGPGHCSVLNDNGKWFLVHHQRTVKGSFATLNVREMIWTEDGWPMVYPERYTGEVSVPDDKDICGTYDLIKIGENTNAMLTSKKLILLNNITAICEDKSGIWLPSDSDKTIITLGDDALTVHFVYGWDYDNNCPTVQFTGTDKNGTEVWGKRAANTIVYK